MNLTQQAIDRITPPANGVTTVYDSRVQSLCVWVSPAGRVTWYAYNWSSEHSKPIRKRLGVYRKRTGDAVGMSIAKARELAKAEAAKVAEGKDTAAEKAEQRKARKVGETVEQVWESFLAAPSRQTGRKLSQASLVDYRNRYKLYLSKWGNRKLADITPEQVQRLHRELTDAGKATTANRVCRYFSSMCNYAKRQGIIDRNPATDLARNPENNNVRYLTDAEAKRFWSAVRDEYAEAKSCKQYGGNPDEHRIAVLDLICFALFTGQRRGNIQRLKWSDVDLRAATMRVSSADFKGKRDHVAVLVPQAVEVLKRRKGNGSPYVFNSNRSQTGHVVEPKATLQAIVKRAGIKNLRFHDLRHSAAAWFINNGADLHTVGKQLGHRSVKTTEIYGHLTTTTIADKLAPGAQALADTGEQEDDATKD